MSNTDVLRKALEALESIGIGFVCRAAHHSKKDQHSALAECPVTVRHTGAIEFLRTALAQQGDSLLGMSGMNRTIAYTAASKLRELGYEWNGSNWLAPAPQAQPICKLFGTLPVYTVALPDIIPVQPNIKNQIFTDISAPQPLTDNDLTAIERAHGIKDVK